MVPHVLVSRISDGGIGPRGEKESEASDAVGMRLSEGLEGAPHGAVEGGEAGEFVGGVDVSAELEECFERRDCRFDRDGVVWLVFLL